MKSYPSKEKGYLADWIEAQRSEFWRLSDAIWSYAELGMEEYRSSRAIVDCLRKNGFTVETGVADMPTAFVATFGSGRPAIGFSCECDALPGLSQRKAVSQKSPIVEGAPGHGCGHNLLGVGAVMAAAALKNTKERFGMPGTIKIFGTPAEELQIGKPFMARAGLFRDMDGFLDWHPAFMNAVDCGSCSAYFSLRYNFKGRTSHGAIPWAGRSALDAALLMGQMIEYLREQITPGGGSTSANTINYSFPDVGPSFPNVVPDRATLWCIGRFNTSEELNYVIGRLDKCAEGAAMATETKVEPERITASHERIPSRVLSQVLYDNLLAIGAPQFTEEENRLAGEFPRVPGLGKPGLDTTIAPMMSFRPISDNSEYSWWAPLGFLMTATFPGGISGGHDWQVNTCVGSTMGKKGMDIAAKVLGASGIDLLTHPETVTAARKEWEECLQDRVYKSLIPETVKPAVLINRETMDKYRPLQEKYYENP